MPIAARSVRSTTASRSSAPRTPARWAGSPPALRDAAIIAVTAPDGSRCRLDGHRIRL